MGQAPGQESNGGGTYCAIASLALMNRLDEIPNRELLLHWLVILYFLLFVNTNLNLFIFCYRLIVKFQVFKVEPIK